MHLNKCKILRLIKCKILRLYTSVLNLPRLAACNHYGNAAAMPVYCNLLAVGAGDVGFEQPSVGVENPVIHALLSLDEDCLFIRPNFYGIVGCNLRNWRRDVVGRWFHAFGGFYYGGGFVVFDYTDFDALGKYDGGF